MLKTLDFINQFTALGGNTTMKIKCLLLIPFLLTGCSSTEKVYDPFKETKNNPIVYDEVKTFAELPYPTMEIKEEKDLMPYSSTYCGINVGPMLTIGGINIPNEENSPFKPEFRQLINDAYDTTGSGAPNANKAIGEKTFNDLCNRFIEYFVGGRYEYWMSYSQEERAIRDQIKTIATQKYLSQFFKHTIKDYDGENKSFYVIAKTIGYGAYKARNYVDPKDYYTPQYLADLKNALSKDSLESYYALFDKYGTEYINEIYYAPSQMMFLGLSCKDNYGTVECSEYNEKNIVKVITDAFGNEATVSVDDFWVNKEITSSENNSTDRVIHYATKPFYNHLPDNLRQYSEQIEYAYKLYRELKLNEAKKEVERLDEDKDTIKDSYVIQGIKPKIGEDDVITDISKSKPLIKNFKICGNLDRYDPRTLCSSGFDTVYIRPKILLSSMAKEYTIDAKLMIGNKKIHLIDNVKYLPTKISITTPWYEIKTKTLLDEDSLSTIKISTSDNKISIARCELEMVYSR